MKRNSTILSLHTRYQSRRLTLLIVLLASHTIPFAHSRTVQYTRISAIAQILAGWVRRDDQSSFVTMETRLRKRQIVPKRWILYQFQ
jgi:hypothetical protein